MDTAAKPPEPPSAQKIPKPAYRNLVMATIGFMLLSGLALAGCVYAYGRMRTLRPGDGGGNGSVDGRGGGEARGAARPTTA